MRRKILYVLFGGAFLYVWIMVLKPQLDAAIKVGLSPILAFILFWSGVGVAFVVLTSVLGAKMKKITRMEVAMTALLFLFALDVILPPLLISPQGELVAGMEDVFYSSDVVVSLVLRTFHIYGSANYYLTYMAFPLFALCVLPAFVLSRKEIIKLIWRSGG